MFYKAMMLASSWTGFFDEYLNEEQAKNTILTTIFQILTIALWVILGIVGAFGAIYAIYLGIQLARADEQGRRDDAKKHLITVCIAVGVTIVLILFFNTFLPMILSAFVDKDTGGWKSSSKTNNNNNNNNPSFIKPLLMMLRA